MNHKKLLIGITIANIFGWTMIELWINRYSNTSASSGAITLIIFQIIAYYIAFVSSSSVKTKPQEKITPANCKHDWQKHSYSNRQEKCIICGSERGV